MSVKARKLKDGSTVYDAVMEYGTRGGKRQREVRTFLTRKEAEAADARAKATANSLRNKTGRLTLSEYIDRCYWPIASRRLAATSIETYETTIEKRIRPALGNMKLDAIDRYAIQRMLDQTETEAVGRKTLATLKTILNEAVGDGFIASNPACARYAFAPKGKSRDNGLILSDFGQIGDYIAEVNKDAPEAVSRLVMTGLTLGLRPEERYALDYEDIDWYGKTVHVRNAYVTASQRHGGNQLKATKTELSNRTVPMPQVFWHFNYYEDGKGPYITNKDGGRLSPSTGRKMWMRYLKRHPHLPQVTLENMRHSYATACIHAGMEVADLSRILGHADINTTYRRYVKPQFADMQRSMVSIDSIVCQE